MTLEEKKQYVKDYLRNEFESEYEIDDVTNIGLAYTTLTDEEIPIQVSINLETMQLMTWINDDICEREPDEIELVDDEFLKWISFDDLISGWQFWIEENILHTED